MAHERKKVQSKTKTLASNPPKNPIQSLQSVQTLLKLISERKNVKNPEEMKENGGETEARESLKNPNPNEPDGQS